MARTSTARSKKTAAKKAATRKTARKKVSISARAKKAMKKPARRPAARGKTGMLSMRAKWIENLDQHEDRAGQSLATRSHEVIQKWAEERGAQPATIAGTRQGERPGVLRFNFPGYGGETLESISWEEWFKPFDERNLVFVFQEHLKNGNQSNFFRLDSPEREAA